MTTFTNTPDFSAEERSKPRIRSYDVNGFALRTEDGINLLTDTWALRFSARDSTERANLLSFFSTQNGKTPFTWTTPFNETAQFICTAWDLTLDSCALSTVSTVFELVYVPGQTNIPITSVPSTAFTWLPDFTTSRNLETKARKLEFGEGYSQSVTIGINADAETWSLVFQNLTNAQRDSIRTFLRGAARVPSFTWQNPLGENGEYVCEAWTTTYVGYNNNSIRADFTRAYGTLAVAFNAYASGFSEVISYDLVAGTAYPYVLGFNSSIEVEFTVVGSAFTAAPGISVVVTAAFDAGSATGGSGGVPEVADSSAFWQYWKYNEADERILLYEDEPAADGAAYWSDWRPFDDEFFFYG